MLYVNNQALLLNKKDGELKEYVEDYHKKIKEYKDKYGRYIVIRHVGNLEGLKINPTGRAEAPPLRTIPLICTHFDENNGTEEWIYQETPVSKDANGVLQLEQRQHVVFNGEETLDLIEKPELAYYILEKQPLFRTSYRIYDTRSIAQKKAEERRLNARLESAIFGETSKLNNDKSVLDTVSRRWGIEKPEGKTREQVQNELYDLVNAEEKKKQNQKTPEGRAGVRGITDFLEDAKVKMDTQLGALVNQAIDEGVITYNPLHSMWELTNPDGHVGGMLVKVPQREVGQKKEVLITAVITDPQVRVMLENAMGNEEVKAEDYINFTLQDIEGTEDYNALKRWGGQLGIGRTTYKKDKLRSMVLEAWHQKFGATAE